MCATVLVECCCELDLLLGHEVAFVSLDEEKKASLDFGKAGAVVALEQVLHSLVLHLVDV